MALLFQVSVWFILIILGWFVREMGHVATKLDKAVFRGVINHQAPQVQSVFYVSSCWLVSGLQKALNKVFRIVLNVNSRTLEWLHGRENKAIDEYNLCFGHWCKFKFFTTNMRVVTLIMKNPNMIACFFCYLKMIGRWLLTWIPNLSYIPSLFLDGFS